LGVSLLLEADVVHTTLVFVVLGLFALNGVRRPDRRYDVGLAQAIGS
jgi:hypothetical protein